MPLHLRAEKDAMVTSLSPGGAVAVGIIVGLLSTTIQSIGLTLQRKSHLLEDEKEDQYARRPPYKRRRWQVGMSMFLLANIVGSTVQITTLPLPVLSTLQASGLVFNTICATLILQEPFTRFSLIGTVLVAIGAVLIGIFGAMTEPSHNLQQLLDLLVGSGFLAWLFSTFFVTIGFALAAWFSHHIWPRGHPRVRLLQGMLYGAVSGILSAHTLLVAKSAVELLVRTIVDQHNQFNRWQSWLILIALLVLALSQLYFLHLGLKLCSTSVLYPFVFCVYNIIAILDGLIYFQQTSRLSALHAGLIALGTVVLLVGVVALSWRLEEATAYTTIATDEEGHARRVRSMSRIATPTLPQTVLAPGMGIVEGSGPIEPDEEPDTDTEVTDESTMFDENAGLQMARKRSTPPSETTPLLRSVILPQRKGILRSTVDNTDTGASEHLHIPKRRKTVAIPRGNAELWDEVNESENYRRRSMDFGAMLSSRSSLTGSRSGSKSPNAVRVRNRPSSSAGGTGPWNNGTHVLRHKRSASMGSSSVKPVLGSRWRFWDQNVVASPTEIPSRASGEADGDEAVADVDAPLLAKGRSAGTSAVAAAEEEGPVEWYDLLWWNKRRKDKRRA